MSLLAWWARWRRLAIVVRDASPVVGGRELDALRRLEGLVGIRRRVAVVSSDTSLEPGVFGIRKPVLIWPRSIGERLADGEVDAILAHELCHVRRRDNLAAAVHMAVEAVFWFHPLVWWLERRLVEERERACDEEVVRLGSEPEVYAESILRTCEHFVSSPLICVAGVTGSDLRKRIEAIMTSRSRERLTTWKKLLLATAGAGAVAVPVVIGVMNAPLRAQLPAAAGKPQAFEVASVKPSTSRSGERSADLAGGRFKAENATLRDLVQLAYQRHDGHLRHDSQISGGPSWTSSDRFDIVATAAGIPAGLDASQIAAGAARPAEVAAIDQVRLMVRALLADRFKLTVHNETRELPLYALVMARNDRRLGPRLRKVEIDCASLRDGQRQAAPPASGRAPCGGFRGLGPGRMTGHAVTMSLFAAGFPGSPGRIVLDRTGLSGVFDLDLEWTPESGPSIFTAVQEQLGLKLDPQRGPVDVLVIDSASQPTLD